MQTSDFTVRAAVWQDDAAGLIYIRRCVFIEEQHVPESLEWDGLDETAVHVLAYEATENTVIGTARLLPNGHIGRMAVLPSWRRKGVGSALLQTLLAYAQQKHLYKVFLHAQITAKGFYQHLGFTQHGDTFDDAGMVHCYMDKTLA